MCQYNSNTFGLTQLAFLTLTGSSMFTPGGTVYSEGNALGQVAFSVLEGSPEHLFWKHCKPTQRKLE